MAFGLRIRDRQGNELLTVTDRITRLTGSTYLSGANGSTSINGVDNGTPFYFFLPDSAANPVGAQGFNFGVLPTFTLSGNTLSWAYNTAGSLSGTAKVTGWLYVGAY
jgi:hypothetical protein